MSMNTQQKISLVEGLILYFKVKIDDLTREVKEKEEMIQLGEKILNDIKKEAENEQS